MPRRKFIAIVMLSLSSPFGFLGFRASAQSVKVDYATTLGTKHPEIFGGNRFPTDPTMAQQVVFAGVPLARNDYYLKRIVPTSTLADYENNVGNLQDPRAWNWQPNDLLVQSGANLLAIPDLASSKWAFYSKGQLPPTARTWLLMTKKLVSKLAYAISGFVISHFIEIWALILVCAASMGFFCFYDQRRRLASWPESDVRPIQYSWKPKRRAIVWLALFVLFLALYICLQLWKEDFAYYDDSQITGTYLLGKSFRAPVWVNSGRLFPLHLQEFNVLMHLTHSPAALHVFVVLQLLAWALVTMVSLSEFTIPLRLLAVFLIMSTASFVVSFSDVIYPERNILFWLAVFILCRRRYSTTASPVFLAGTFISVQFALYYKEPVWLLFAGFAATKLVCDWSEGSRQRPVRNFIRENLADIGTLALAVLFPVLFALVVFQQRSLTYLQWRQGPLSPIVVRYLRVDFLFFIFLAVVAVRVLRLLRARSKLDSFWDPLAIGGALYALAIIDLRIFRSYCMAPVDAIAILFLLQRAHDWLSEGKAVRTLIVAGVCFVIVVQNMAHASMRFTIRKNVIAGNVQLVEFLKGYIQEKSNGSIGLFFPYSDDYDLMELSAFFHYKGLPLGNDAPHGQGDRASLVVESPLLFQQNRCYTCLHTEAPHNGDLIVELASDNVPEGEVARNGCEELLFSYEPFLVSQKSVPLFNYFLKSPTSNHTPDRFLQVRVYKCSAPS
jgi:hypothetical protein